MSIRRLPYLNRADFYKFKAKALRYIVYGRYLFRKKSKNVPLVRVVDDADE